MGFRQELLLQFSKAAEAFDRHEDAVAQEQKTRIDLRIATNRLQQFLRDLCSEGAVYGDLLFTVSDDDDAVVSITRIATISANPTPAQILAEIDPAKLDPTDDEIDEAALEAAIEQDAAEAAAWAKVAPIQGGSPEADATMREQALAWEPSDDELDDAAMAAAQYDAAHPNEMPHVLPRMSGGAPVEEQVNPILGVGRMVHIKSITDRENVFLSVIASRVADSRGFSQIAGEFDLDASDLRAALAYIRDRAIALLETP